jgi:hypothetical protein
MKVWYDWENRSHCKGGTQIEIFEGSVFRYIWI